MTFRTSLVGTHDVVAGKAPGPWHIIHARHRSKLDRQHQHHQDALHHVASPSRLAERVVSQLKAYYTFIIFGTIHWIFSDSGTARGAAFDFGLAARGAV